LGTPMNATQTQTRPEHKVGFRHEALFYDGDESFVKGVTPFILDGVETDEVVFVLVNAAKIDMLRAELGGTSEDRVLYADMAEVGRNPARLIPTWREFLDYYAVDGRRVRGVSEPISAARTPHELVECQRHEALLNVAFAGSGHWRLLCPYDAGSLPQAVLGEAARNHPVVTDGEGEWPNPGYQAEHMPVSHLTDELPEPARCLEDLAVGPDQLARLRSIVAARGKQFGMDEGRADDLTLAVHEIAANSVCHGGGVGAFRLWREAKSLICEIRDGGHIEQPLAGREHPELEGDGGRGLWVANQLCDLVQIRSSPSGAVVRLHMSFAG
jgi:anti-sigma regulatory factor (Ser/Thr protein kinase)